MSEGLLFILIPSQPAFAISPEGSEDVLQMDNTTEQFMMGFFQHKTFCDVINLCWCGHGIMSTLTAGITPQSEYKMSY